MPPPMTDEKREEIRLLYENEPIPVAQICAQTGISVGRLYRLAQHYSWHRRKPVQEQASTPASSKDEKKRVARARHMTFNRLRTLIERELELLGTLQNGAGKREPLSPDQAARTFASLVRTLGELKKLQDDTVQNGNDDAPEDIEAVRSALAERLDRLRAAAGENH